MALHLLVNHVLVDLQQMRPEVRSVPVEDPPHVHTNVRGEALDDAPQVSPDVAELPVLRVLWLVAHGPRRSRNAELRILP